MRRIALLLLGGCAAGPAPEEPIDWLEACVRHGYTQVETAMATGLEAPQVAHQIARRGLKPGPPPPFTILPYPGGRHPRIGFLEGAIDPHRDTKFSLFLPGGPAGSPPGGGYVVVDFPEAVWVGKDLVYLAHTHIPTSWEKKGVKLARMDWTRKEGGVLEERRVLPDGLEFFARVTPAADGAELELRLRNGTDRALSGLRAQVCVLLKGAPGFGAQTRDNKVQLKDPLVCAARSEDGKRWIATAVERGRTWENPPCPCIHADPSFPDLAPGAEAAVRGRVFYFEGEDLAAEVARRAREGTLLPGGR
jgi:hypothetical protein